jgi:hypothetical protein
MMCGCNAKVPDLYSRDKQTIMGQVEFLRASTGPKKRLPLTQAECWLHLHEAIHPLGDVGNQTCSSRRQAARPSEQAQRSEPGTPPPPYPD